MVDTRMLVNGENGQIDDVIVGTQLVAVNDGASSDVWTKASKVKADLSATTSMKPFCVDGQIPPKTHL